MALSNRVLNEQIRKSYLQSLANHFSTVGEEVLETNSNELSLPVLDSEGNEKFVVITVKVPTGSRDGEAYDGYAVAEDYKMRLAKKAEREREKEAEKAKKIIADEKRRQKEKNKEI